MPKKQKMKKKSKENNCIKELFSGIVDSIIGEVIINLLMFIPRMIGKVLKVIFN